MNTQLQRILLTLSAGLLFLWTTVVFMSNTEPVNADVNAIIYTVCPAGAPTCNFNNIQAAVDAANAGDIIKVAAGTYTGINNHEGLAQVVYIDKNLFIEGGFTPAFNENSNPDANPTIVDAQGNGRVFCITGNNQVIIAGFHMTGGNSTNLGGHPWGSDAGGGVYINQANVKLRNNRIYENTGYVGAGVYLLKSSSTLRNNIISDNGGLGALTHGGGVSLYNSPATILQNTIIDNDADFGAGLYLVDSQATIRGNTISQNKSSRDGGGISLNESDALVVNNRIENNSAKEHGAGLSAKESAPYIAGNDIINNVVSKNAGLSGQGGGIYLWFSKAQINDNVVEGNEAEFGGGLYGFNSDGTVINGNTFRENYANSGGGISINGSGGVKLFHNLIHANRALLAGGVFLDGSTKLEGNHITANKAENKGGGLYSIFGHSELVNNVIADNEVLDIGGTGSGIYVSGSSLRLLQNTIAQNDGGLGIGVFIKSGSIDLINTIIVKHAIGVYVSANQFAALEGILWGAGEWANGQDFAGPGFITTGTVNLHGNPGFVDPENGDYHLTAVSDALDVGVNTIVKFDVDFEPRLYVPDLGFDEYWSNTNITTLHQAFIPNVVR